MCAVRGKAKGERGKGKEERGKTKGMQTEYLTEQFQPGGDVVAFNFPLFALTFSLFF
jgi:hypothetical protein